MKPSLKNMRVGTALALSYLLVVALYATSVAVAFFGVHQNSAATTEFYDRPYQVTQNALGLSSSVKEIGLHLEIMIQERDPDLRKDNLEAIEDLKANRSQEMAVLKQYYTADPGLLSQFETTCNKLVDIRREAVEALQANDYALASALYEDEYKPSMQDAIDLSARIVESAETVASDFVHWTDLIELRTYLIIGALGVLILTGMLVMWRRITHAVVKPVEAIEQAAERVALGDLSAHIDYESKNELGSLAASINKTISSLKRYIKEVDDVLSQLSEGDLEARPRTAFAGDYATIGDSLQLISDSLRSTMTHLDNAAEQVARSSSQMSDGSQSIAQGSAEQAMAIEELTANVQDIERVIEGSTENMMAASSNTADVLEAVKHGNAQIAQTVLVVQQIKDNTKNISQLANVIEDISFQTNILALNASVEAARAGEAGRGFSVVAEEVRRLAAQVSEASQAADELTGRTIASIRDGSAMIETVAANMDNAVTATGNVKELMAGIAQASAQQLEAATQIRESMDRLTDVVQENSAAAEESAVIAEELAEQASGLKKLTGRFTFDRSGHDRDRR